MPLHGVVTCECACDCWYLYCLCADQDPDGETPHEKPYLYILVNVPTSDGNCSDDPIPNDTYYHFKQFTDELQREGCYKFHEVTETRPPGAYLIDSNSKFTDELTAIGNCWQCLGMTCDGSGSSNLPTLRNIIQAIALGYELIVEVPSKSVDFGGGVCCRREPGDPAITSEPIVSTVPAHTVTMSGCSDDDGVGMCINVQPDVECDKGKVPIHGGYAQACQCHEDFLDGSCILHGGCCPPAGDNQGACPCDYDDRPPELAPSLTGFVIQEHSLGDATAVTGYFGSFTHDTTTHTQPNGDELPKRVTADDTIDFCPKFTCDPGEIHDDCCPPGVDGDECLPQYSSGRNPYTTQFPGINYIIIRCEEDVGIQEKVTFQLFHGVTVPVKCSAVCEPYNSGRGNTCTPEGRLVWHGASASWFQKFGETTELEFDVLIGLLDKSVCDD